MSQAGLGLFIKLWESTDDRKASPLRPDLKARWDDAGANGKLRDYVGTLGFTYAFGGAKAQPVVASLPPPAAPASAAPCPASADRRFGSRRRARQPGPVPQHAARCRRGSARLPAQGFDPARGRHIRGELGGSRRQLSLRAERCCRGPQEVSAPANRVAGSHGQAAAPTRTTSSSRSSERIRCASNSSRKACRRRS